MSCPTEFRLDGKVILVTGAAGLIGSEICDAYLAYGAQLVITDRCEQRLRCLHRRLQQAHPQKPILAVCADLSREAPLDQLFAEVEAHFRRLHVLVNLAALDAKFDATHAPSQTPRFEEDPLAGWEQMWEVNCTALLRITQRALRLMLPYKEGNIINVASTYSLVAPNHALYREGEKERFKPVDYVATKSMVPNFSRYLATLYGGEGIRCNTVVPHGVENGHSPGFQARFAALSPLGRMCRVGELRGPFVFLASEASSYMTGSLLLVDGGWTAW